MATPLVEGGVPSKNEGISCFLGKIKRGGT